MTAFGAGLVLAIVLTPFVLWLAHRHQLIDVPNERSSHVAPVPRGGGLAVAVAVVVTSLMLGADQDTVGLVVGGAVLGAVGLLDDRRGLPPLPRLAVQLMVPALLTLLLADRSAAFVVGATVFAALWVSGFVNAFNFMDGINGISALQATVVAGALAVMLDDVGESNLVTAAFACAGAALGFLPFNAPKARIFLGDVGSYFLGFWLSALGLFAVDREVPVLLVLSPFMLYLLDTGTVLVRRARRGAPLMEAHREHAYQRLVQLGHSHLAVSGAAAVVSASCFLLMWAAIDHGWFARLAAFAGCLVVVVGFLTAPSVLARRTGAVL